MWLQLLKLSFIKDSDTDISYNFALDEAPNLKSSVFFRLSSRVFLTLSSILCLRLFLRWLEECKAPIST